MDDAGGQSALIGRDDVLARVVAAGRGPALNGAVLAGVAGVGKTRLAREAAERLGRSGRRCLWLGGTRAGTSVPFSAFAPLFDDDSLEANPMVAARHVLRQQGPHPSVVVVDDAHLLDGPSAMVLLQLAQAGEIQLLATLRHGEPVPDEVLALWTAGRFTRIDLVPLGDDDTAQLCSSVLGDEVDPRLSAEVGRLSGGLPLYVRELLLGAAEAGDVVRGRTGWGLARPLRVPPRVADLVGHRLDALTPEERQALELVALAEPVPLAWLETITEAAVLTSLERSGRLVARTDSGGSALAWLGHPLTGELLRRALPLTRRRQHVERLSALAESAAPTPIDRLRGVRWRLEAGLPVDNDLLVAGAQDLVRAGDYTGAVDLASAAWAASPSVATGHLYGMLLGATGNSQAAGAVYAEVAPLVVDERDQVRLTIARTYELIETGECEDEAVAECRDAIDAAATPAARDELTAHLGYLELCRGRGDTALDLLRPILRSDDPIAVVTASNAASLALSFDGRPEEAIAVAERAHRLHEQLWAEQLLAVEPQVHLVRRAQGMLYAGRLLELEPLAEELYQQLLDSGIPAGLPASTLLLGMCATERGHLATADLWLSRSIEYFERYERPQHRRWVTTALLRVVARRGDLDRARALSSELDVPSSLRLGAPMIDVGRAWLVWREGRPRDVAPLLHAAVDRACSTGNRSLAVAALHDMAMFGHAAEARQTAQHLAGEIQGPLLGTKLATVAAVADRDVDGLIAAGSAFESMGADLAAADAFGLASVWLRPRDAVGANRMLVRAHACEARCEGARAEPLLGAGGTTLTPRELEVSRMAAAGLPSKEIGSQLGISRRTVDNLLARAYQKLGVSSRSDLAAVFDPVKG